MYINNLRKKSITLDFQTVAEKLSNRQKNIDLEYNTLVIVFSVRHVGVKC